MEREWSGFSVSLLTKRSRGETGTFSPRYTKPGLEVEKKKRGHLLLLWRILNGRGLPNCLTELPSLKCLSSSLHSRDSHPFANVLRPSPSGSPSVPPRSPSIQKEYSDHALPSSWIHYMTRQSVIAIFFLYLWFARLWLCRLLSGLKSILGLIRVCLLVRAY